MAVEAVSSICRYSQGKMLDFIFVVGDPCSWHADNLTTNSAHYSSVCHLGPSVLGRVQGLAAGVYFNPLVYVNGKVSRRGRVSHPASQRVPCPAPASQRVPCPAPCTLS